MCGLVAVINRNTFGFSPQQIEFFKHLLFVDTLRGDDSTGMFCVSNVGNVEIAKSVEDAPQFLKHEESGKLLNRSLNDGWALVGHNRKATRGNITDENAHPFWVDDKLVLVHNGTMFEDHKKHADVEVDSHAIAHILAEEQDVDKALHSFHAAYALIWYDIQNKALKIARNDQRPLWGMKMYSSYIIASERVFLDLLLTRAALKPESEPAEFLPNVLHTFQLQDNRNTLHHTRPIVKPMTPLQEKVESIRDVGRHLVDRALNRTTGTVVPLALPAPRGEAANLGKPRHIAMLHQPPQTEFHKVLMEAMVARPDPVPATFNDYKSMVDYYPRDTKINIVVKDILETPSGYFLVGETCNKDQDYAAFKVEEEDFDKLIHYTNDTVFEVVVDRVCWKKTEDHKDFDKSLGVACLSVINPVPLQQQANPDACAYDGQC
jgi:hypothetical protein